jgi:hypothetical protein
VGAAAITGFGVDVSRLHCDLTSISLYGAYPQADQEYPAPRWGHPKDRRPDLRQIQTGLAVSGDGGIPVFHRAYDGGAAEVAQVVGAMTALKQIAGPRRFLLVGDSKLISYTSAAAMNARGVGFVAPLAAARVPAGLFAALPPGAGGAVDYTAGRDAGKPAAARGIYRVLEDGGMDLPGPRKADPAVHLRRILVYSSANAAGAVKARALKLAKATEDLDRLARTAGTRFHPTPDAVTARVTAIATQRRVKAYLRTTITRDPAGRPVLSWHFDRAAIDTEAATDGWYALLTNLEPSRADPAEVFRRYKGQHAVERRYGEFKGPLAVAPLFLKTNRRITALITVICLALLIFCLAERQVRKALRPHGEMMTRPARLRPHPSQTHWPDHLPGPRRPAPDPRARRQPRRDPQTRRRPGPAAGPPRHRHQPTPLAHQVKSHVRRTGLASGQSTPAGPPAGKPAQALAASARATRWSRPRPAWRAGGRAARSGGGTAGRPAARRGGGASRRRSGRPGWPGRRSRRGRRPGSAGR